MKLLFSFLILLLIGIGSCQNNTTVKRSKNIGEFDKTGNETGIWLLKDSAGNLMESGRFESGLMVGTWKYYSPIEDEWKWKITTSPNGTIKTSFPDFIRTEENSDSLLIATSIDSAIGFTAIVSNKPMVISSLTEYSESVFSDLHKIDIKIIDSARQLLETEQGQQYIFHHILCLKPTGDTVQVFNMAIIKNKNRLMEITVRCENRLELFGRRTFYSIAPHTFINGDRFADQRDKVIKKIGRQEY